MTGVLRIAIGTLAALCSTIPDGAAGQQIDATAVMQRIFASKLQEMRSFPPCSVCNCDASLADEHATRSPPDGAHVSGILTATANDVKITINVVAKYRKSCSIEIQSGTSILSDINNLFVCGPTLGQLALNAAKSDFRPGKMHGVDAADCVEINHLIENSQ